MGRWFEAYVKRRNRNTSASFQELEEEEESSEESEDEELQLEEDPMLRTLDPKDWKVKGFKFVSEIGHFCFVDKFKVSQHCLSTVIFIFTVVRF